MSDSLIQRLVFARLLSVEPFARAVCPEIPETSGQPFSRPSNRWRETAVQAGWSACNATSLPYGLTQDKIDGPQGSTIQNNSSGFRQPSQASE